MLHDLVEVHALSNYCLHLKFDDGISGEVDIAQMIPFDGVFAPFADQAYFAQVQLNEDLGTVCWPNGADLDPEVLYAAVTGKTMPSEVSSAST